MELQAILDLILKAQSSPCDYCVGASLTAIAAAFQTQGMFVQADLLWYLNYSGMSAFGPLIYTCAFMAGLVNVALGMPARNYLWCFLGPTFFLWLTDNPDFANGTRWQAGATTVEEAAAPGANSRSRDMTTVWRLAEVGLANSAIVYRYNQGGVNYASTGGGAGPITIKSNEQPSAPVEVAAPFVWWDELVSWNVQWLVAWTGATDVLVEQNLGSTETNIAKHSGGSTFTESRWDLLRNNTWQMVEDMTNIRFSNPDSRDAFVNFMASECGEVLGNAVDQAAYAQALKSRGANIPKTVLKDYRDGDFSGNRMATDDKEIFRKMRSTRIPVHRSVRALLRPSADTAGAENKGSFRYFLANTSRLQEKGTAIVGPPGNPKFTDPNERILPKGKIAREGITCHDYFFIIMNIVRWEAGLAYHGLIQAQNLEAQDINENKVVYNLYYGWGVRGGSPLGSINDIDNNPLLDVDQLKEFTRSLMTIFLFRNEMSMAPQISNVSYTPSQNLSSYADSQQKSTGAASKYGEIYTWAMMVPYMQGITLYFLAAAYPIACLAVIFPGMHKVIFTWMSFWLWVKLWDVGFAMVMAMERSLWAMLGHSKDNKRAFQWVNDMTNFVGGINYTAPAKSDDLWKVPEISPAKASDWTQMLYVFDTAMMLGGSLDIDLSNAYYVYLTSALYFAVPAVTGQCVLGAKAGAAGLVTGSFQQQASDAGRGSSAGMTGNMAAQINQASSTASQSSYESGLRQGGLAGGAINAGFRQNESSIAERTAGMIGTGEGSVQSAIGQRGSNLQARSRTQETAAREGAQAIRSAAGGGGGAGGLRGALSNAPTAAVNIGGARYAENLANKQSTAMTDSDGRRGMANMAGSVAGGQGQMYGQAQNRLQEAANYDAQNRQADQMRNTQLATAGKMAAMGQMAGGQYGYNRPTGMPTAVGMMGGLGQQAQDQAMAPISRGSLNADAMNSLTGGQGDRGVVDPSAIGAGRQFDQIGEVGNQMSNKYYGNSVASHADVGPLRQFDDNNVRVGDIGTSADRGYNGGGAGIVNTNPDNVNTSTAAGREAQRLGGTIGAELTDLEGARTAINEAKKTDDKNQGELPPE